MKTKTKAKAKAKAKAKVVDHRPPIISDEQWQMPFFMEPLLLTESKIFKKEWPEINWTYLWGIPVAKRKTAILAFLEVAFRTGFKKGCYWGAGVTKGWKGTE